MPILDTDNEIQEYISVRHDITDIYNLTQEIEDTQKRLPFTMGSIVEKEVKRQGHHVKRVAEYSRILAKTFWSWRTWNWTFSSSFSHAWYRKVAILIMFYINQQN